MIAAATSNRIIGRENQLPWKRQHTDMAFFLSKTRGKPVVMGRHTYRSLPDNARPLPRRPNIILTSSDPADFPSGVIVLTSVEEVLRYLAEKYPDEECFIIGGGKVYAAFLPFADRVYLTEILTSLDGDARFPELPESDWKVTEERPHPADAKNEFPMVFRTYERR